MFSRGIRISSFKTCTIWLDQFQNFSLNSLLPEALLTMYLDRLSPADYDRGAYQDLLDYLRAGGTWTGNDAQIGIKAPGLLHLIVGSSEYQFV